MSSAIAANGVGGDFKWRYCTSPDHVEAAVDALMNAVKAAESRLWNPYNERYTRGSFRNRIKLAERGELKPPKEVKRVRSGTPAFVLYEIRWSDIKVIERREDGMEQKRIDARLYYVEPPNVGLMLLGLHCHEKRVDGTPAEIREWQDAEIDKAENLYNEGMRDRWGVLG